MKKRNPNGCLQSRTNKALLQPQQEQELKILALKTLATLMGSVFRPRGGCIFRRTFHGILLELQETPYTSPKSVCSAEHLREKNC